MLDPSRADHYRSGYERSRLFPGGRPTLEFVRSLELLGRLLPAPAVVLFGPLYHLTSAEDRRQALAEARRVLRPGGRLMAMTISRCASLLDGLYRDCLDDPVFRGIVDRDLAEGQHRNQDPAGRPEFFTTAYFHTAAGLAGEISGTGFSGVEVYGVEGPGWPLDREWADSRRHEQILLAARAVESDPSVIGFSHHFIAAATRH
jgi:SAM-dependent methyltransferase